VEVPHAVAIATVRTDEAGHDDHAAIREQLGHFADAADVLLAVFGAKTEVFVEPVTDIVPVEHVGQMPALNQGMLERERERAFPRTAQPGKPQSAPALTEQLFPLGPRSVSFMPGNIGRFDDSHVCP